MTLRRVSSTFDSSGSISTGITSGIWCLSRNLVGSVLLTRGPSHFAVCFAPTSLQACPIYVKTSSVVALSNNRIGIGWHAERCCRDFGGVFLFAWVDEEELRK